MNKAVIITLAFLSVWSVLSPANADINVYLLSQTEKNGKSILLRDIARYDSDTDTVRKLDSLVIGPEYYRDGYIDRVEIGKLIESIVKESVLIFGNAVRVEDVHDLKAGEESKKEQGRVNAGEAVHVRIRKNGITIELKGNVMQDGRVGDDVNVEVRKNRIFKGKVRPDKTIEFVL